MNRKWAARAEKAFLAAPFVYLVAHLVRWGVKGFELCR